ncbi:MAG: hypothetical protein GDA56_23930 [Hormoscilla sp. GM7CHS1pb]|nr:hypothetical protein [Hormoscilla sp. GM7CHS1pb]
MKWRKGEISPPDRPRYRTYTPNGIAPRSREDQKPGCPREFSHTHRDSQRNPVRMAPTGISYGFSPINLW